MNARRILPCFSLLGVMLLARQQWLVLRRRIRYLYIRWIIQEPIFYRQVDETDSVCLLNGPQIIIYAPTFHDVFEWKVCWALTRMQLWNGLYPKVNGYQVISHTVNHKTFTGVAMICLCHIPQK